MTSESYQPCKQDVYFPGVELATFHSHFGYPDDLFVGFKSGQNTDWHAGLEIGDFTFDALNTRWITDIGGDSYSLRGYSSKRTAYRKRAEGQNTVVINPTPDVDQLPAWAKFDALSQGKDQSFAITDMTAGYANNATSLKRGILLNKKQPGLLVQDELHADKPVTFYSFMHTEQTVEILDDHTALMKSGDKRLFVKVLSPDSAVLTVMKAQALRESAPAMVPGQNPNLGIRKLAVTVREIKDATVTVYMVPLNPGDPIPTTFPRVEPLQEWGAGAVALK